MRLIWTSENPDLFRTFCSFLVAKQIAFSTEEQVDKSWESEHYGTHKFLLWIYDEEQVLQSMEYLTKFLKSPTDPEFTTATVSPAKSLELSSRSQVTKYLEHKLHQAILEPQETSKREGLSGIGLSTFIVLFCSLIFLLELWSLRGLENVPPAVKQSLLGLSPIKRALLFDYPHSYELLDKIVRVYGYEALIKPQNLPPAGRFLYEQYLKAPVWQGYYPYIVSWAKDKVSHQIEPTLALQDVQLFEKIREGQVWRLVTPALLHNDILHLFFNMIWVLLLGIQIETRIGALRYLLLMIVVAVISNIAQYLMSGPNFIGFSGVICGMATFIKARQKIAPWEGYLMSSSTFAFICFFIGTLAVLSLLTFFLDIFGNISFPIAIANTAHLVGALSGYGIGKLRFFTWQH